MRTSTAIRISRLSCGTAPRCKVSGHWAVTAPDWRSMQTAGWRETRRPPASSMPSSGTDPRCRIWARSEVPTAAQRRSTPTVGSQVTRRCRAMPPNTRCCGMGRACATSARLAACPVTDTTSTRAVGSLEPPTWRVTSRSVPSSGTVRACTTWARSAAATVMDRQSMPAGSSSAARR